MFILKVYSILCIQLLITVGLVIIPFFIEDLRKQLKKKRWILWVAFGILIGLSIVIFCGYKLMRKVPLNYIILFLYTIVASVMVATIAIFYDPKLVLVAAIMTLGMFVALTIFAFFIKSDLTIIRGLIFTFLMTLLIMILFLFIYPNKYIFILISALVVVLISIYIIYDTKLIAGHDKYN